MIWTSIIVTITALLIGGGSIFFLGEDNAIEEICEDIVEEITGIEDIDFSPCKEELKEEINGI